MLRKLNTFPSVDNCAANAPHPTTPICVLRCDGCDKRTQHSKAAVPTRRGSWGSPLPWAACVEQQRCTQVRIAAARRLAAEVAVKARHERRVSLHHCW